MPQEIGHFEIKQGRQIGLMDPADPSHPLVVQAEIGLWKVILEPGVKLEACHERWPTLTLRPLRPTTKTISTGSGCIMFFDPRAFKKAHDIPTVGKTFSGALRSEQLSQIVALNVVCSTDSTSKRVLVGRPIKRIGRIVVLLDPHGV